MMIEQPSKFPVTFEAVKQNKRLWLREVETGKLVYTPPSWVNVRSRQDFRDLADKMNESLGYDINVIIEFEVKFGPKCKVPYA